MPSLSLMLTTTAWEFLSIDILELPQSGNYRYALVIHNYFTKWLIAIPKQNQIAECVVEELTKVFAYFGFPRKIHSNQVRNFESFVFKSMCRLFGTNKSRTSAYHPHENGLVERANRSIVTLLRKVRGENNWHIILPLVPYLYNTSIQCNTKITPYEAL
ncbi:Pol polyprotein [Thelohanellus kitauei]|uniref:Pol polyprotein n=1 Tax=Thelohanellus kitauei TaxID=669202 RepID=A0A0C2I7L2_THEKT|nr:Pol polyprotein [Thelohanellus kitauei]